MRARQIEAFNQLTREQIVTVRREIAEREPVGRSGIPMGPDDAPAISRNPLVGDGSVHDVGLRVMSPAFIEI